MAKKTLVIDGDPEQFSLAVAGGTLRIADDAANPAGLVRVLRVVRVRCEIDVEGADDGLRIDGPDATSPPRPLAPGGTAEVGRARLSLLPGPPAAPILPAAPQPSSLARRLVVIDGADRGLTFKLPAAGGVTVGKVGKGADIGLDDLYVARVHCRVTVDADGVTVTHLDGQNGTLIDGARIDGPRILAPGCVLRVGNSHLRLEAGAFADDPLPAPVDLTGEGSRVHKLKGNITPPAVAGDQLGRLEGQTLGHFRVGPLLGRGFTGAVYQATDAKTGQPAAVKVLAGEFPASAPELERFSRAVREANPIRHPNLVTPLGAGKTGPHCWIAREFVDGESAADVVERVAAGEKPSWTRAARVAVHLARVLDCLHGQNLPHGNITPRNVLIRKGDRATKLADLRLAQAVEGSRLQAAVLEKKLLAELSYLAPELADPGAVAGAAADLYGLGAVAYALATGRPPFAGRTPEAVLDAARNGRLTRPSVVYRKIPPAFEAVVLRLLAVAPDDRYPSAAALLEDLEPLALMHDIKA